MKRQLDWHAGLIAAAVLAVVLMGTAPAGAEIFIDVDGIDGESNDAAHPDWIDADAFSHGIARGASMGVAGAQASVHGDFAFTKKIDKATPLLHFNCASGTPVANILVEVTRDIASMPKVYMKTTFHTVAFTSVETNGSIDGGPATETVTFTYSRVEWEYTQYDAAGNSLGKTTKTWNVTANTP